MLGAMRLAIVFLVGVTVGMPAEMLKTSATATEQHTKTTLLSHGPAKHTVTDLSEIDCCKSCCGPVKVECLKEPLKYKECVTRKASDAMCNGYHSHCPGECTC